jgi:ABC-2 type transport system permease protein
MRTMSLALRHELVGLGGVIERNIYLVKRYIWWDVAFFPLDGREHAHDRLHRQGASRRWRQDRRRQRSRRSCSSGAVIWAYLGIIFEILTETVAWERWEGTIEYTVHGAALPAGAPARDGPVRDRLRRRRRAVLLFGVVAAFFSLHLHDANYAAALVLLIVASISFIGIGMMTAVLPLISPEKGTQLGFVAQGLLLVVSGVYYPVSVLPGWMQAIAKISPATYALRGCRAAILDGAGPVRPATEIWALLVIGAVSVPLGLWTFRTGERYAKKHGKAEEVGDDRAPPCETGADYEAWLAVRRAVLPNERTASLEELRAASSGDLHVLAEWTAGSPGAGSSTLRTPERPRGAAGPARQARLVVWARPLSTFTAHASARDTAAPARMLRRTTDARLPSLQRFGLRRAGVTCSKCSRMAIPSRARSTGVEFVSLEERPELLEAAYRSRSGLRGHADRGRRHLARDLAPGRRTLPEGPSPHSPTARSWATRACSLG